MHYSDGIILKTIMANTHSSIPEVGLSIAVQIAVNDLTLHCAYVANNWLRGKT